MYAVDILAKKRDGLALSKDEIDWFVRGYTTGEIPDYQAAALLMAICIQGMNREETANLTLAMVKSGQVMGFSDLTEYSVDKHSSGGVGDKTTLVVLPLVASCGVLAAKMSGRGLGYSGGTIDKLEAIAGYDVNLSDDQFRQLARENGIVLAGQSRELAPADGMLYALRDVTGTVPSLPLIASSIMSKKIAAGANGIVLDVKVGNGAFMDNLDDARELAQIMVNIGVDAGRDMVALLSDMNQPLGCAVGNALETREAIEIMQGAGPGDFLEHCLVVASQMLRLAGQGEKWVSPGENQEMLARKLENGEALSVFRRMIAAQGGDVAMVDDPAQLPQAEMIEELFAPQAGFLEQISAYLVSVASFQLGAGRAKKGDPIDFAVGVEVHRNVGDQVTSEDVLFTIHANSEEKLASARQQLLDAVKICDDGVDPLPLFYDVIEGSPEKS